MYVPNQFAETRRPVLVRTMRAIGLATLVTPTAEAIHATHVPTLVSEEDGDIVLSAHFARVNPQAAALAEQAPSLAIFQGPQAYISPSWYESKRAHGKVVPTWNYIAIHAHGTLEAMPADALPAHLEALTQHHEGGREAPWAVDDAPADYIAKLSRAIVGVRLRVARIEGSWKMAQHKPQGDRTGAATGLLASADPADNAVGAIMAALEAERSGTA